MTDSIPTSPELQMLLNNKKEGYEYRKPRDEDIRENYTLYHDKVQINRLLQRQSVNVPLMKQTIKTILKDIDDMPVMYFENIDNDKDQETFLNEYWKYTLLQNNADLQDIEDKKQELLCGRTFMQWQIIDGKVVFAVTDPQDILVSRYVKPSDLNTSRFLIHTNIYVPLSVLEADESYDKVAVSRIKDYCGTKLGLVKIASNSEMVAEKNRKLEDLGFSDTDSALLGETWIELALHFVYRPSVNGEELYLFVEAENQQILMKKPLEEVIGKTKDNYWRNHFPYSSWAEDLERQYFWSDGTADSVRTINKILNVWMSQLVENRTLRNFGMHYYDATKEGFSPSTQEARPFGWYGVPGKPSDVMQKVEIPDLSDSLDEMQFLIAMSEKVSGATPTQQGVQTNTQVTLGEVQLALGQAQERIKGISKFYTPAWKQRAEIFLKLIEAGADKLDAVKVYKKGKNTNDIHQVEIDPKSWKNKANYLVKIWSQEEKNVENTNLLQKLNATKSVIVGNKKLDEIYKRKLLEFSNLTPDEINEVMAIEEKNQQAMETMGMTGGGIPSTTQPGQPTQPLLQTPMK